MIMEPFHIQAMSWHLVHFLEPAIWWIKALAAGTVMVSMFPRFWDVTRPMQVSLFFMLAGCFLIFCSPANTALGPLGDLVFWPCFAVYKIFDTIRRWPQTRKEMLERGPGPERLLFEWARGNDLALIAGRHPQR